VDAKAGLGDMWPSFQEFFSSLGLDSGRLASVAFSSGPLLLARAVQDGSQEWPVMQQGRN